MEGLRTTTTALDNILTRLDRGEGTLGKMLHDEKLYDDVDRMFVNMDRLVSNLDELVVDLKANPGRYLKVEIF